MVNPSTWIFKLRQGVRFHNRPPVNGREMTAEDVKYSYELLKDKVAYATRAALVKAVHVIDKYTVKFELAMPDPKFYLNVVDSLSPVIVPREAVEAPGGLAENPIGTGAFMLKEFAPGEGALLVRNPDYYLKDKDGRALPYVDAVRLYFTKDRATDTALFRARQIDLMRVPTLDVLYALMKTVPDLQLYRVPSFGWGDYGISMTLDKPPFNQAIAAASPIGAGPSFMDWAYLRFHSSYSRTVNRASINDPRLDDLLATWRQDSGDKRPVLQRAVWDHLRANVYRITTIVPPHYRLTQVYVHAGANPYCWFPGYCSYEAKTTWMTDKAPNRKFEKFAQ